MNRKKERGPFRETMRGKYRRKWEEGNGKWQDTHDMIRKMGNRTLQGMEETEFRKRSQEGKITIQMAGKATRIHTVYPPKEL